MQTNLLLATPRQERKMTKAFLFVKYWFEGVPRLRACLKFVPFDLALRCLKIKFWRDTTDTCKEIDVLGGAISIEPLKTLLVLPRWTLVLY